MLPTLIKILPKLNLQILIDLESKVDSNPFWTSEAIIASVAILASLVNTFIIFHHLKKVEHEKNSLEKFNQIASLIALYFQLNLSLKKKNQERNLGESRELDKNVIEINRMLTEIALWLPKDIYESIHHILMSPSDLEMQYPVIINHLRKHFNLKTIQNNKLRLLYLD